MSFSGDGRQVAIMGLFASAAHVFDPNAEDGPTIMRRMDVCGVVRAAGWPLPTA